MSSQAVLPNQTKSRAVRVAALIEGKDERLGILSAKPVVLETPHSLLAGHAVTPLKVLFVRNVQQLAEGLTVNPLPLADWDFELAGLIGEPVTND